MNLETSRVRASASTLIVALTAMAVLASETGPVKAPSPVVERMRVEGPRTVRLSLFDNRVAVVATRDADDHVAVSRLTLSDEEYGVYLAAIRRDAALLDDSGALSSVESRDSRIEIRISVDRDRPQTISYSSLSVLDLATGRFASTLDDLELRVLTAPPGEEIVRHWQPRKGDRVRLVGGHEATVSEVWQDGTLVLVHDETYLMEEVSPDGLAQVIIDVSEHPR